MARSQCTHGLMLRVTLSTPRLQDVEGRPSGLEARPALGCPFRSISSRVGAPGQEGHHPPFRDSAQTLGLLLWAYFRSADSEARYETPRGDKAEHALHF